MYITDNNSNNNNNNNSNNIHNELLICYSAF